MPEITGIQLARLLPKGSKIIFTTAYSDFALDGFEVNASDYLVKPISFEQFISSTNRITNNFISSASEDKSDSIFVKTEYRLQQVKLQHIQYIKGMGDYSIILTDREKLLTLENMKSLEERLPSKDFIRVHKSYIIPFNKIDFIEKNRIKIKEDLIPIGNTYQDQFWLKIENR